MGQKQDDHTFYLLLFIQAVSLLGSTMTGIAVGIWVFQRTGQATPLTLVAFAGVLPRVMFGSIAGVLVDRWDRRRVLLLADGGQAFSTLLLAISLSSGSFEVWHLYVVAMVQACCAMFQEPAFQATITLLVPDQARGRANALQQLASPVAGTLAPALVGWLYLVVGAFGIMVIDLGTFCCALIVLLIVRIPGSAHGRDAGIRTSLWHEARFGFAYLYGRRGLLWLLVLLSLVNVVFLGTYRLYMPYILMRTGDPSLLGAILGIMNMGGLCGGLVMAGWGGSRRRLFTLLPAIFLSGLMLFIIGVSQSVVALSLSLFGIMLFPPFINVPLIALIQRTVPADLQGRIFALVGVVAQSLAPIAFVLLGPLIDLVFEPAVGKPDWRFVAPIVGATTGSGIGLFMVIGECFVMGSTLIFSTVPAIHRLEADQ